MISISEIRKTFQVAGGGEVTALNNLNMEIEPGEFFVIVGASGSGKTTLLRTIAGLETPDSGTLKISGRTVFSDNPKTFVPAQDRGLGMVFQSYAIWPHMTVFQNVALPLKEGAQKIPSSEVRGRVEKALSMVQLDAQIDRPATLLSGGQQQRVALARAIAVQPSVLLMDEPLSNLDARLRESVRGKIRDLAKLLKATVFYVTHDQVEAMAVADKIALMSSGKLLQLGTPKEVYSQANCPEVAEFFGAVNWLPGKRASDGSNLVRTEIGDFAVASNEVDAEDVWVGFRPEHVAFTAEPGNGRPNEFQADLVDSIFLGDQYSFDAQAGSFKIIGKSRYAPQLHDGKLNIAVDQQDIMVFPADETNTTFIKNSIASA